MSVIDENETIASITTRSKTARIEKNNTQKLYENVDEISKIKYTENSENESEFFNEKSELEVESSSSLCI